MSDGKVWKIGDATAADALEMAKCHESGPGEQRDNLEVMIPQADKSFHVARDPEASDTVIGYTQWSDWGKTYVLKHVQVHEDYRRQGVTTRLIEEGVEEHGSKTLRVTVAVGEMQIILEVQGFVKTDGVWERNE